MFFLAGGRPGAWGEACSAWSSPAEPCLLSRMLSSPQICWYHLVRTKPQKLATGLMVSLMQVPRVQPAPLQSHLLWERKHPQVGNSDQCWTLQLEIGIGLGLWTGRRHQTISVCASCFHPDYFFCSLRFFHPGQSASFYRGRGTCWHWTASAMSNRWKKAQHLGFEYLDLAPVTWQLFVC